MAKDLMTVLIERPGFYEEQLAHHRSDGLGMERLPLMPRWMYVLRNGQPAKASRDINRVIDRDGEVRSWDGTYDHQSTVTTTWKILVDAKAQGMWSSDTLLAELLDERNVGGARLRRQDDPVAKFWQMWSTTVERPARWSVKQQAQLLLELLEAEPGAHLRRVREVLGGNRGDLDKWLDELIDAGEVREEREYGPSGVKVTSRRFWRTPRKSAPAAARSVSLAVSMCLLGLAALQRDTSGAGQMIPVGGSTDAVPSLLRNVRARDKGRRVYFWLKAKRREARKWAAQRAATAGRRAVCDDERRAAWLAAGQKLRDVQRSLTAFELATITDGIKL